MARSRAPFLHPFILAAEAEKAHRGADKFNRSGKICSGPFMAEYRAGRLDDFKDGGRLLLKCDSAEIGIFMIGGELYAWYNECAHRGGPVCQGRIMKRVVEPVANDGTVRTLGYHDEDIHIVCPWHGYEFNIKTGEHPGHAALKLRKAKVTVREGAVYVSLG
jgi:nitrite reductase (NADH) small subunit